MTFDYDVAIVGAGPIGSTLAYELALEDLKVCLIDKKKVIGLPLQCAGIVNTDVLKFNEIPGDLILNRVRGAYLHSPSHDLMVSKSETQAFVIDRVALDQFMFERARESVSDVFLSSKVIDIDSESGKIRFMYKSDIKEIKSKIIIGADGPKSIVSSKIGNDFDGFNASQYLVKVERIEEMSFVDLYAREKIFPGFLWAIPVYENIFRIGLFSRCDYREQTQILDDFLENDFKYDDYEVLERYKGRIPIYDRDKRLVKDRVLLIGDSASQVKPTTGGGLLIGFESVKLAKNVILDALAQDELKDFDALTQDEKDSYDNADLKDLRKTLENYQKEFEKRFSSEFNYQFKVQKTLSTLSDDDLDYFFVKLKENDAENLISKYGDMDNQSKLVKEFLKRGLVFSLLPVIHKKELAKIWLHK